MIKTLIARLAYRRWVGIVTRQLCRCYEVGIINSLQMHMLIDRFSKPQTYNLFD